MTLFLFSDGGLSLFFLLFNVSFFLCLFTWPFIEVEGIGVIESSIISYPKYKKFRHLQKEGQFVDFEEFLKSKLPLLSTINFSEEKILQNERQIFGAGDNGGNVNDNGNGKLSLSLLLEKRLLEKQLEQEQVEKSR